MTLDHANHIVESGAGDMVSMVRALIADPELVNKAQRGEEDRRNPWLYQPGVGTHMTYDELAAVADPEIKKQLTPEIFQRRHEQNQLGLKKVADALEEAGVVLNDSLIASWDGSRLLKDAANPRVEITLEELC